MTPTSEAELAELISAATTPFAIRGGGTRVLNADDGPILDTTGMSGISLYEPGALTVVAGSGTPVQEIANALKAENQRLAFEPPNLNDALGTSGESTIGGVAASNASGPRRIAVGACRDFMLGVRFVDGAGNIVKNGGRVMKNVTGYDLVKLMSSAHGTLGVLSEVSLKVLPNVEFQVSLRLADLSAQQAIDAMSSALGSPFEVSGAARDADGSVLLRFEGFEASVRYRAESLMKNLAAFGAIEQIEDQETCEALWSDIRDARAFAKGQGDLWRISVKPSDAPEFLEQVQPSKTLLDWGGGLIWAELPSGTDIRAKMTVAGHATLMRAGTDNFAKLGRFHPEPTPLAKISADLRARFDPKGLFNPGLMGDLS
ncbi:FAD-binding protein [Planktotalea sp.]|uniref:FAD-binding protein n=1 Tax=Planktotalea sp. TaxID=2029877 RepID=UPI003299B43F